MTAISAEFAEAFLAAQQEMPNPAKDHTANIPTKAGGSFSYKYAGLDGTMVAVKTALNNHGITVAQPPVTSEDGRVGIRTELTYKGGEVWDRGTLLMNAPDDPQKLGSILTYLRRYGLTSAVGVVAEDDDDGGSGKTKKKPPAKKPAAKPAAPAASPPAAKKGRTPQEHIASVKAHFGLFQTAYDDNKARSELLDASEFEKKDRKTGELTGEMMPGYTSPDEMEQKATAYGIDKSAARLRVVCHKIETAWKKQLAQE